jgi:hypothetical protein
MTVRRELRPAGELSPGELRDYLVPVLHKILLG